MKSPRNSSIYPSLSFLWIACIYLLLVSTMAHSSVSETQVMQFTGIDNIRLENIDIKVDINTHSNDSIEIKVFGPREQHELIQLNKDDSELIIKQTESTHVVGDVSVITHSNGKNSSSRSVVTIGGKTTIVEGDGVVVTHSMPQTQLYMEILIPAGTPLSLIDFTGKATIGNIASSFHMQGSGKVSAGNLADVDLDIYKNAKIDIAKVENYLYVQATDNSKLQLKGGEVKEIQADLSGNSRVKYEGHAHKGKFTITDNGKLFVSSVDQSNKPNINRNGRLTVGNW